MINICWPWAGATFPITFWWCLPLVAIIRKSVPDFDHINFDKMFDKMTKIRCVWSLLHRELVVRPISLFFLLITKMDYQTHNPNLSKKTFRPIVSTNLIVKLHFMQSVHPTGEACVHVLIVELSGYNSYMVFIVVALRENWNWWSCHLLIQSVDLWGVSNIFPTRKLMFKLWIHCFWLWGFFRLSPPPQRHATIHWVIVRTRVCIPGQNWIFPCCRVAWPVVVTSALDENVEEDK